MKKVRFSTLILAGAFLLSVPAGMSAKAQSGEHVNLRPDSVRNLCLDLSSGDGAKLASCTGGPSQRILLTRRNSGERIMKVGSDCIEGVKEGEALFRAPCRPVVTQTWTYSSSGEIRNGNGLCIDVWRGEKKANTPIIAYRCTGHVNQRWARYSPQDAKGAPDTAVNATLYPLHASNKCVDLSPEGRLILWGCHGGTNQKFSFQFDRTGQVKVNGKCLSAHPSDTVAPVVGAPCRNDARQRWTVSANGQFKNGNGACLDVSGAETRDGTPLITYPCSGSRNQTFKVR